MSGETLGINVPVICRKAARLGNIWMLKCVVIFIMHLIKRGLGRELSLR